ncbi:MAG: DUF2169 domain-containing protein [Nannocystaceae bacterium]|nr:DUF2169 domain-containing protein [Nannocystaceae bacterium]
MSRESVRPRYDAVVDLHPRQDVPIRAYGIVKFTYDVLSGQCVPIEPEPLALDIRDPEVKFPAGSDFWPFKGQTDVLVLGNAYPKNGLPAAQSSVQVSVGNRHKRIQVWGKRHLEFGRDGTPSIGAAEPFTEMHIGLENAYGGADERVPVKDGPLTVGDHERLLSDHPGMYPRNPFGKGYVVHEEPFPGIELHNLDDPQDPLTAERILVKDPRQWWKQPLPWSLDWVHAIQWPRIALVGADAWFPAPQDAVVDEVRRGFLPKDWRKIMRGATPHFQPAPIFFQEASYGMTFAELREGTPITVDGMHPEGRTITFKMPAEPRLQIHIEGQREVLPSQLTNLVIHPADGKVTMTYSTSTAKLPRVFIPGVHGKIPLSMVVSNDAPIVYDTPTPVRELLKQAGPAAKPNAAGGK